MEQLRIIKKQLVMDLDKNEAPCGWRWRVDRIVKFPDGAERVVPDEISATAEEVSVHIGAAVSAQAADISRDSAERDELRTNLDKANARLAKIAAALQEG